MKYIMIGDLHGKLSIAEEVLGEEYDQYHKVFLGDYVDSFEGDVENQIKIVTTLLDAVEERDDVTALLGNHELSYLRSGMQCSGWNGATKVHMFHLKNRILNTFVNYKYLDDDVLCTHAGATKQVFKHKEYVREALEEEAVELYFIGYSRGGSRPYGGIFWCDYWEEFKKIKGLTQIVGHSARRPHGVGKGIVYQHKCYNVDCLDRVKELLTYDTENKEFNTVKLYE